MNLIHRYMCRSARWQNVLSERVLPWALKGVELGDDVLEVGPGPGLTTDLLRTRLASITAVEIDARLANALAARLRDSNVKVVLGDATAMEFKDATFSGAVSFTMLHHVPSVALQDKLLREVRRVLKPGGTFAGIDSRMRFSMRLIHIFDTLNPVDPETFGARLEAAGFGDVFVDVNEYAFRFRAKRPE